MWFLQCLSSLPINVLKFIVVREYLRELHLRAERVIPGEGPKYKGKPIKLKSIILLIIFKLDIEKNAQEDSTTYRTGKTKKNFREEKKGEEKKEEKKDVPNLNLKRGITRLLAKRAEEKKQNSPINKSIIHKCIIIRTTNRRI